MMGSCHAESKQRLDEIDRLLANEKLSLFEAKNLQEEFCQLLYAITPTSAKYDGLIVNRVNA